MTDFDPTAPLGVLVGEGVEFDLIGGYAALVHGATRPTEDVDVTPATHEANLVRLARAPFDTSAEAMRGLLTLNLTTSHGDLDLTFTPSGTAGFEDLNQHAIDRQVGAIHIRVACLPDVIRSKEAAGRDKDIRALTELYRLLGEHQDR